jgi:hypothetical protein
MTMGAGVHRFWLRWDVVSLVLAMAADIVVPGSVAGNGDGRRRLTSSPFSGMLQA